MEYAAIWLICANLAGLLAMGSDKRKAIDGKRRIPEKTLFLLALFGGSIGVWAGMYLFRHKTRHIRFVLGIPFLLLLQAAALYMIFYHQFKL